MVVCIFSSLPFHHSPHLSISWQGVINLILGEIQGSTFYTLRNLHNPGLIYIVVILTKSNLSGSFSWEKCGKFLTPYVLIPEFDVSFSSGNETFAR